MRSALLAVALAAAAPARPDGPPGLTVDVPVTAGVTAGALGALPLLLHRGNADEKSAATLAPFSLGAPGIAISGTF